jgi:hypothetical protein
MYQRFERAITDADRRRLLACMTPGPLPVSNWRRKLKLDIIAQIGGFGIAVIALIWFKKELASLVIPAAMACWLLYWIFKFKGLLLTPRRKERDALRAANDQLAKSQEILNTAKMVRGYRVEAQRVIEVVHDEGVICLFDIGDNRTFWIDPYIDLLPGKPSTEDFQHVPTVMALHAVGQRVSEISASLPLCASAFKTPFALLPRCAPRSMSHVRRWMPVPIRSGFDVQFLCYRCFLLFYVFSAFSAVEPALISGILLPMVAAHPIRCSHGTSDVQRSTLDVRPRITFRRHPLKNAQNFGAFTLMCTYVHLRAPACAKMKNFRNRAQTAHNCTNPVAGLGVILSLIVLRL